MRNLIVIISLISFCMINAQTDYPNTIKKKTSETYFGTEVTENYQWLEDDRSAETGEWVKAENDFTDAYLSQVPNRDEILKGLTKMMDYEKQSMPFEVAGTTYIFKNDGLQPHSVMYRVEGKNEEVFLDPNTFSEDGSISLGSISFSKDGSMLAYQISRGGADWTEIVLMETKDKKVLSDTVKNVKFSNVAWLNNDAFFYSTYDKGDGDLSSQTLNHKLYKHIVNTPQKSDQVIFGNDDDPRRYVSGEVSDDQNYLIVTAANKTYGNELYIYDLRENELKPKVIQADQKAFTDYLFNQGMMFYLVTDRDAPNKKIVKFDYNLKTGPDKWYDFIPENKFVMSPSKVGDKIIINYMVDANSEIVVYGQDGSLEGSIELPGKGSVSGFGGDDDSKETYYSFENYITPSTIFKYELSSGTSTVYSKSKVNFDSGQYESEQLFYASSDGTQIPITISYKKGTKMNGENPTILYGYGGFNVSIRPGFSTTAAYWMSQGGIYAVANIRGGGEYGQEWHNAGTQMNKKNVFNDFIAAANFLKGNHYTSKEYLAIRGGSNGGLLVGAVMTMQPDICAVALPAVGVLDMLKYHKFTSGAGWAYDYGTSEDSKEMFDYLYSYSPVHNVKDACYPATLITTGDHDDRVVPAHSFKFAAELQDHQTCSKPVLIRIETNAGHGAGKSTDVVINEYTDIFSFTWYNMGKN